MPICTYLGDDEYTAPTGDSELDELLGEVRVKTGRDWRISVHKHVGGWNWWQKPQVAHRYTLYCGISGGEFQEINFRGPNSNGGSINTMVSADVVSAFLYGVLNGIRN